MKTLFIAIATMAASINAYAFDNQRDLANFLDHQDHVEKRASELALERSANKGVRAYAARVAYNHTVANIVLNSLARQESLMLEQRGEYDDEVAALESLRGKQFDAQYAKLMIAVHAEALKNIDASKKLDETPVGAFAQVVRSRVEDGLKKARELK
jgi:putative membrane protein